MNASKHYTAGEIEQYVRTTAVFDSHYHIISVSRLVDIAEPTWLVHVRVSPNFMQPFIVYVRDRMLALCRLEQL